MTLRLLVAEDDAGVATIIDYGARLLWPDCSVTVATSGTEALHAFAAERPDLVVLDVTIPPPDGFAVCRRIRESSQVPILMLTARSQTADKVRAFDLGADDYLTKPFDHLELLARLRALVRRSALAAPSAMQLPRPASLQVDGITLDPTMQAVHVRGQIVSLTGIEYRLLEELVRHAGRTLPYAYLLRQVWGDGYVDDLPTLRMCIQRLRGKLGDGAEPARYVHTERNIGYRFSSPR